jgi:hypothetical protein
VRTGRQAALFAALLAILVASGASCRRAPRFGTDFESDAALDLFDWSCRTLYRLTPEHATSGTSSLEISFHPAPDANAENYPGLAFSRFDPDWRGCRSLAFDAFNPESVPLQLGLRIDDREAPGHADRVNRSLLLAPGANRVALPLAGLLTTGTGRALDRRHVRRVLLFLSSPRQARTLYLDNLRLE